MSELFSVVDCDNIVQNCLKRQVRTLASEVVPLPNDNFILKATIFDGTQEKTLRFFAKKTLKKPQIHQILFDFKNTIPKFNTEITPKLYYEKSNVLFFEDLTWQGFQICSKSNLDLDHVRIVLKVLAKLHCGGLVYEEIKTKETGDCFTLDNKYKVDFSSTDPRKAEVVELLSSSTKIDDLGKVLDELDERQRSTKSRRTLCHGNLLMHNIMFKYEDQTPRDCKLINFKTTLYLSPICDVLQLLFFTTTEDLRQHHFEDLLRYYHTCIDEELRLCFLESENILLYEQMRKDGHQFLPVIKLEKALHFRNEETLTDLQEILSCSILSREDCYAIVRSKIGTTDYQLVSFVVTPLDQANGYLGTYHKLTIKILRQDEETLNCFVKTMPKNKSSTNVVQQTGCFFKEVFIYKILVPQMQEHAIEAINECLASCYFQRAEDLLVFEDMTKQNYRMLSAQVPFDFSLLSLTMTKLAKFHASTMIFEEMMSKQLDRKYRLGNEYEKYLREIFFSQEQQSGALIFQVGVRSIIDLINLFPELQTDTNQHNFNRVWSKLQTLFFKLTKPSQRYRNVVAHGDLWTNNIMVKFDGTQPIDCVFVDFQCTRYCPPAHDFLSAMYLTTDRATRMELEEEMKILYYKELAKVLGAYGYDVQDIFSHGEFLESVEHIRPQMVLQAIMYKMFTMCTPEEISSLLVDDDRTSFVFFEDRKEYLKMICERSSTMKRYMRECLVDLYALCDSFVDV